MRVIDGEQVVDVPPKSRRRGRGCSAPGWAARPMPPTRAFGGAGRHPRRGLRLVPGQGHRTTLMDLYGSRCGMPDGTRDSARWRPDLAIDSREGHG